MTAAEGLHGQVPSFGHCFQHGVILFYAVVFGFTALFVETREETDCFASATGLEPGVAPDRENWPLRVLGAVGEFCTTEVFVTLVALEFECARKYLPVDVLPVQVMAIAHVCDELVDVPLLISHMLRYDVPVKVDEYFCFGADHPLPVPHIEELVALGAAVQHIGLVF